MSLPKIAIVTPSYNQGQFLEETIQSVINQNYHNLEYIIIDGGSTDNSVEIIKKYEDRIAYWVSEKDRGQTHAINKGFKKATGEVVNWLNSDDLLEQGALKILAKESEKNPTADFYFGDFSVIGKDGNKLFNRKCAPYQFHALFWGRQLSSQPAVFFRRNLLKRIGYLEESLNFCMDIEFWIRAACNGAKFHQIKSSLGIARFHGGAKTARLQQVLHDEHKMVVRQYNSFGFLKKNDNVEDLYYTFMNRFFRMLAATNRMIFRRDFTFRQASKALAALNQE